MSWWCRHYCPMPASWVNELSQLVNAPVMSGVPLPSIAATTTRGPAVGVSAGVVYASWPVSLCWPSETSNGVAVQPENSDSVQDEFAAKDSV